jgi:phosphohistidine swiveling domain-containing protein
VLLVEFLRTNLPDAEGLLPVLLAGAPSVATERQSLASRWAQGDDDARLTYLSKFGEESGAWDVSVPTWAEGRFMIPPCTDDLVPAAHACHAREILDRLPRMARGAWKNILPLARDAAALHEDDDWVFARLQTMVRRALLALGHAAVAGGRLSSVDQVFDLPFSIVRRLAAGDNGPDDLETQSRLGRARWEAARTCPPPVSIEGVGPLRSVVRGVGTGGRVVGIVHRFGGLSAPPPPPACVLVALTLLPSELPLIRAAALVTVSGGPLDHVAAQARERGIPAVVGAANALELLAEGDRVLVDADAGVVVRLGAVEKVVTKGNHAS